MATDGKRNKIIGLATAAVFLVGFVLATLPAAEAQTPICPTGTPVTSQLSVTDAKATSGSEIRPITGQGDFSFVPAMTYDGGGTSISPILFTYTATADQGWASVVLTRKSDSVPTGTTQQTAQVIKPSAVTGQIFLDKNAPAFAKVKIKISFSATGGTCIQPPTKDGEAELSFTAGFYGKMQARLDKTIIKAGQNAQVTLPLIVENFGNGELLTKYEHVNVEKADVEVVLPGNIIVPTAVGTSLDPKQQLPIDVNTPFKNGYMNDIESVVIKVTSVSNDNQEITGPEAQVNALIRTQGVYVPGFEMVTSLGAIALLALAGLARRQ